MKHFGSRSAILAGLTVSALATVSMADSNLNRSVDSVFASVNRIDGPGCAAGVMYEGEYIHSAGYGMANLEHGIPITSKSVFRTGSLSKQFTAMAVAILAQRGELDLDADVHKYLPDLIDYGHEVTIRQMVHHIAGMGDYDHKVFTRPDGTDFRFGNEDYWTIEEFYQRVAQAELILEPGEKYEYSNLGYFLLAHVVERVSGRSLREFAETEMFSPLEMQQTFFNDSVNRVVRNRANGYRLTSTGNYETFNTNLNFIGDGGVFTSLEDFIKWDRNFYDNQLEEGGPGLIDLVTTPHPDAGGYAFGMNIGEALGESSVRHTGGWVAFSTVYQRFPDLDLSVVVFCNDNEASAADFGDKVAKIAVNFIKSE